MSIPEITLEDFQRVLTPQNIKVLQIIFLALGLGVLIFAIIAFAFYFILPQNEEPADVSVIRVLTIIHLLLFPVVFYISKQLYDQLFQGHRFSQLPNDPAQLQQMSRLTLAENLLAIIRTTSIVRLAVWEALALFGLTICFLGSLQGVLPHYPLYWMNLISAIIFEMIIFNEFPSRPKLELLFREKWSRQTIYR